MRLLFAIALTLLVIVNLQSSRAAVADAVLFDDFSYTNKQQMKTNGWILRTEPGWPRVEDFPLKECLYIVVNEEYEHRQFAERDLAVLAAPE